MHRSPLLWLVVLAAGAGMAGSALALPRPADTSRAGAPGWLSFDEIKALAAQAGFPDPDKAARIAWRESRGNPRAAAIVTRPLPGNLPERSFGLWQVNTLANPQFDEAQLLDPAYNAQAAYQLYSRVGWRPWGAK